MSQNILGWWDKEAMDASSLCSLFFQAATMLPKEAHGESKYKVKELPGECTYCPNQYLTHYIQYLQQVQQGFNFKFILVPFPWPGIGR